MRIAMIGSRGIGSGYGGIERVLDDLCPQLVNLGHKIDVYSRPDVNFENTPGLRAIPTNAVGGKFLENISRSAVATSAGLGKYDLIHFHAMGPGILSSVTRTFGQKAIVTIHGLDHKRDKWGKFARFCLSVAEWTVMTCADQVTVVSEDQRRYLLERYDTKVAFIPNGRPHKTKVAPGRLLQEQGLAPGRYLLFASRLTPEKGCHDLIAAFNGLDSDVKLVIAGGTGAPDYLAKLRADADPNKICFVGHRSGQELAELFSNALAFVLPSYVEGMSMALLEAVGYGIPSLVSDIPENRAVVGEYARYFAPRHVEGLRLALSQLLDQPEELAALAQQLDILPHPDWATVARQYDHIYQAAISRMPSMASWQSRVNL